MANAVHFFRRSTITRKHRPMTKAVVDKLTSDDYANGIMVLVDGCIITNTSKYIDFASGLPLNELYDMSYGRAYDGETAFLFFVDSIEPNNFNEIGNTYYRAYITIDWWSTLLYRHGNDSNFILNEVINRIEGEVERGHVNDIQKIGTELFPTLENTYDIAEEDVTRNIVVGDNICLDNGVGTNDKVLWWYCLCTPSFSDLTFINSKVICGNLSDYDKQHRTPVVLCFRPIKNGETLRTHIETPTITIDKPYRDKIGVNGLTDERIVHSFVSKIPPCKYRIDNIDGEEIVVLTKHKDNSAIDGEETNTIVLEGPTSPLNYINFVQLTAYEGVIYDIASLLESKFALNDRPLCRQQLSRPTNYQSYSRLIVKSRSEIYNPLLIVGGGTAVSIPLISSKSVYMCINFENGCLMGTYTDYLNSSEYARNFVVGSDLTFDPISKVDRWKVFSGAIGSATESATNVLSGVKSLKYGKIGLAIGVINAAYNTVKGVGDMLNSKGGTSTQPSGLSQTGYVDTPQYVFMIPANRDDINTKLMIYGYNTPLRFRNIFYNHRRKYYNYIKMVTCDMSSSRFTEEIRQSIEQMFKNGVWLWNSVTAPATDRSDGVTSNNSMGYLFLNNYPLVIDE